ncbi:hypothetical protein KO561_07100 [Radiobacillus kanasensis]|uniref:hypothetical protein n=1 Tax=Radiobacillus kanasensis TaxID=2844358 RepID=UPI001E3D9CEF|nr:hypothetical protein [Radiobacillus kanasensis]UFU00696.1 hypothetical protein KO561_07100 [Radiobacillus kanasensis]
MKKWAIAAVIYLLLVIAGYSVYANVWEEEQPTTSDHDNTHEEDTGEKNTHTSTHDENSHVHESAPVDNEIEVDVSYQEEKLQIKLQDEEGEPITDLQVNHEKIMHLIVVDNHLDQYFHLHPGEAGDGVFEVAAPLEEGSYKAFVDIKSESLSYSVVPKEFQVGEVEPEHSHPSLTPDTELIQKVNGQEVSLDLQPSTLQVGEKVRLDFQVDTEGLEPYLGAMGHVVILDGKGEEFVHVHPSSDTETKFQTTFSEPGVYKIWAEFQHQGTVKVYPFVLEVK